MSQDALCSEIRNNKVVKLTVSAAANVATRLLEDGPQTASALADALSLTGTAIRRHLDALIDDGYVEASELAPYGPAAVQSSRGRGRPAKVFALTSSGRAMFGRQQDSLGLAAVKFMASTFGTVAVKQFAESISSEFMNRHSDITKVEDVQDRALALVDALNLDGYAASIAPGLGVTTQICQHNCPMGDVAVEFPILCEVETEMFSQLTGVHVTRLATIAKGDPICTTLVPLTRRDSA